MGETLTITEEKDLVKVAAKSTDLYGNAPLTSLTAYTLHWLHHWQLRRTIEAIAVLNWRLFPEKFAMVGFSQFPDAFRTNRSLLQMQPKYRNLLTGAAVKGFSLNERGRELAIELTQKLGVPSTETGQDLANVDTRNTPTQSSRPARSIEPEREVQRLRESKLFKKWQEGVLSDRDLIHVHALLGIFDHTPPAARARAMRLLEKSAKDVGDADALRFLADVRRTFPQARIG